MVHVHFAVSFTSFQMPLIIKKRVDLQWSYLCNVCPHFSFKTCESILLANVTYCLMYIIFSLSWEGGLNLIWTDAMYIMYQRGLIHEQHSSMCLDSRVAKHCAFCFSRIRTWPMVLNTYLWWKQGGDGYRGMSPYCNIILKYDLRFSSIAIVPGNKALHCWLILLYN